MLHLDSFRTDLLLIVKKHCEAERTLSERLLSGKHRG
jgi:hypothetical protein